MNTRIMPLTKAHPEGFFAYMKTFRVLRDTSPFHPDRQGTAFGAPSFVCGAMLDEGSA
jgi:hypothetical protein